MGAACQGLIMLLSRDSMLVEVVSTTRVDVIEEILIDLIYSPFCIIEWSAYTGKYSMVKTEMNKLLRPRIPEMMFNLNLSYIEY